MINKKIIISGDKFSKKWFIEEIKHYGFEPFFHETDKVIKEHDTVILVSIKDKQYQVKSIIPSTFQIFYLPENWTAALNIIKNIEVYETKLSSYNISDLKALLDFCYDELKFAKSRNDDHDDLQYWANLSKDIRNELRKTCHNLCDYNKI